LVTESLFDGEQHVYEFNLPVEYVQEAVASNDVPDNLGSETICIKKEKESTPVKTKTETVSEYVETKRIQGLPSRFGNHYIQEAIDFGPDKDADIAPAAPADEDDKSKKNVTPEVNDAATNATEDKPEEEKSSVENNDVSDEIVDAVKKDDASKESDNPEGEEGDLPVDNEDIEFNSKGDDIPTDDNTSSDDISLDGEDAPIGDTSTMSVKDLLDAGLNKLKEMTPDELKQFVDDAGGELPETEDSEVQLEYAFNFFKKLTLNKSNIKKELKTALANSLGILNSTEHDLIELLAEFKKSGKELNVVLSKAVKIKGVFSPEDLKALVALNKVLLDIMKNITVGKLDNNDKVVIKRLVAEFVSQAKVVNKIVGEDKKGVNK
jgi:ribosomal protein L12E/L44/L45/RPP1/RPP2/transcription termination factor NusB